MLARLRQRTVVSGNHKDRTVDLRGTGDHVFDVVGVARHVDVGVVALLALVLLVRSRDRDTARFFFRRVVDVGVVARFVHVAGKTLREHMSDRSGQSRFTVVDVTHGTDIDVRL